MERLRLVRLRWTQMAYRLHIVKNRLHSKECHPFMLSVLNPADYMWNHDGLDVIDGDPPSSLQVRKDIIKAIPMFLISLPPFAICLVFT